VAGRSGGTHEAVVDGLTGLIVDDPRSVTATARAVRSLLDDDALRASMASAARARAVDHFTYDGLAAQLGKAIDAVGEVP
jgi:glycosyltransferase involved in cell wall biosynthesis